MNDNNRSKFKSFAKSIIAIGFSLAMVMNPLALSYADKEDDWNYVKKEDDCSLFQKMTSNNQGGSGSGSNLNFLTPGTETNKVAHEIYDYATDHYGLSGAAAIAMMANASRESAFFPDRAETGGLRDGSKTVHIPYHGPDAVPNAGPNRSFMRFGMNNKNPVEGMAYYVDRRPQMLGGGGLFQETPYTVFANSQFWGKDGGDGWGVKNQIDFVMNDIAKSRGLAPYINGPIAVRMRNSGQALYKDVPDLFSGNDPVKATASFFAWYERGYFTENRGLAAKQIAASGQFDVNKPADPSKWPDLSGGGKDPGVSQAMFNKAKEKCVGKVETSSELGKRIVEIAWTRVGGTYILGSNRWGSSYRDTALDCSGLVMETLKRAGLKSRLPRLAREQGLQFTKWGWETTFDKAQPGDIIVYSDGGKEIAHHIVIYGGKNERFPNGFIVHASTPTRGIRLEALYHQGNMWIYHPQNGNGAEFGEPDLSDTNEMIDFNTAYSRSPKG